MVAGNGPVDSEDDKEKSNKITNTDDSRHHSILLQVRKACNKDPFSFFVVFPLVC